MLNSLLYSPALDLEQARKGRWLNIFVLSLLAVAVLFIVSSTFVLTSWPRSVIGKLLLLLVMLAGIYLINRRGWVQVAAALFVISGILQLNLLAIDPKTNVLPSLFIPPFFVLILIIAGIFLSWRLVPALMLALIANTVWLYQAGIPGLPFRTTDGSRLWLVTFALVGLLVLVGALSWLSSRMIQDTLEDLRRRNRELEAAYRDMAAERAREHALGANIGDLAGRLAAVSARQINGVSTQARSINQVVSTVAELHATANQIAAVAQEVRAAADTALQSVQQAQAMVLHSREAVRRNRVQVEQVITRITALEQLTLRMSAFVNHIRDLSEETQLLALNATIEAAGAGTMGRRFNVVATEVQNLANRADEIMDQIRELLRELQAASTLTLETTQSSIAVANEVEHLADDVRGAQEQVVAAVQQTTALAHRISTATDQQTVATEHMAQTMQAIAEVSDATSQDTTALELAIGELSHAADLLNNAMIRLRPRQERGMRDEY